MVTQSISLIHKINYHYEENDMETGEKTLSHLLHTEQWWDLGGLN